MDNQNSEHTNEEQRFNDRSKLDQQSNSPELNNTEEQNLIIPTHNDEETEDLEKAKPHVAKMKAAVREIKFEDTTAARCEASKLQAIYLARAIVSATLIIFGLTTYEYWVPEKDYEHPSAYLVMHILMTLLSVLAVILYLIQIFFHQNYLKIKGIIDEKSNALFNDNWILIIVYSIFLLIHPIYDKGDSRIGSDWEGFFDGLQRVLFSRMYNEYLILIQFTTHYITILYFLALATDYAGPQMDRICRTKGCNNSFMFIFRVLLIEIPTSFSTGLTFLSLLYFSVAIRITENGYLRSTYREDFDTQAEFEEVLLARGLFWHYKNTIWNIFITMSTIGYGDINVFATFSRVMIFFVALTGLITISIMVVAFSSFFELDNMQTASFNFFNALELKLAMTDEVSNAFNAFITMYLAARKQQYTKYKYARINMESHLDKYKLMSNYYISLYGAKDLDSIKTSVIRADDEIDNMMNYIYTYDDEVKKHVDGLPERVKNSIRFLFKKEEESKPASINE